MTGMNCPKGHGAMTQTEIEKQIPFRGEIVSVTEQAFACPECGFTAGTIESAATLQEKLSEAYRKQAGLLTGEEIKLLRLEKELTQGALATLMNVGIASVKRWENGAIQSKSMDTLLRRYLEINPVLCEVAGNRKLSIPRIRMVADAFHAELGRPILVQNDKMLFAAKYLWYADMLAYRKLGRGMTGATYAHLPYGPQLNNYRDLLEDIQKADVSKAEPLTEEELVIIKNIALTFPKDQQVFDASHKEPAWLSTMNGDLILYCWAEEMIFDS